MNEIFNMPTLTPIDSPSDGPYQGLVYSWMQALPTDIVPAESLRLLDRLPFVIASDEPSVARLLLA